MEGACGEEGAGLAADLAASGFSYALAGYVYDTYKYTDYYVVRYTEYTYIHTTCWDASCSASSTAAALSLVLSSDRPQRARQTVRRETVWAEAQQDAEGAMRWHPPRAGCCSRRVEWGGGGGACCAVRRCAVIQVHVYM